MSRVGDTWSETIYTRLLSNMESFGTRQSNGCLEWNHSHSGRKPRNDKGYGSLWVNGKEASLIRVVYHHFVDNRFPIFPSGKKNALVPDHTCRNTSCFEPSHLRLETNRSNVAKGKTSALSANKTSEYVGVSWDKTRGKWAARIRCDGVNKFLGRFDNEADASSAYQKVFVQLEARDWNAVMGA